MGTVVGETSRADNPASTGNTLRQPWKSGSPAIPENKRMASMAADGDTRFYMDTILLQRSFATKIAMKGRSTRSFIRILAEDLQEIIDTTAALMKESSVGRIKTVSHGKMRIGIYDEAGLPTCKITEIRGNTTLGAVSIPKSMKTGNGWGWLLKNLKIAKNKLLTRETRQAPSVPPYNPNNDRPETGTKKYKDALLNRAAEPEASENERTIRSEKSNGITKIVLQQDFGLTKRKELESCLEVQTLPGYKLEELQEWMCIDWKMITTPKLSILGPKRWLVDVGTGEEKKRILALKEDLKDEVIEEIKDWSDNCATKSKARWIYITGIPIQLWCKEILLAVAETIGSVLEIEEDTKSGLRMDRAKIKVKAESGCPKFTKIPISLGEKAYTAQIELESPVKNKVKAKKRKNTPKPPGKAKKVWRRKQKAPEKTLIARR